VAALVVEVAHEGRAVGGREDGVAAADDDGALGVSRVLRVLRRRRPDRFGDEAAGETDALAVYLGAGLLPEVEGRLVTEIEAELLEDGHRLLMDALEPLRVQQLVEGYVAGDVFLLDDGRRRPLGPPPRLAASAVSRDLRHSLSPRPAFARA